MKSTLFFLLIAFVCSCQGQGGQMKDNLNSSTMTIPAVTKEFEKYDFSGPQLKQGDDTVVVSNGIHSRYQRTEDGYAITVNLSDSYFLVIKEYYNNEGIKEKYVSFNSGDCPVGMGFFYDEMGKLIKEENFDAGYKFSIERVLEYLTKSKIPYSKGIVGAGYPTKIFKIDESGKMLWVIKWMIEPTKLEIIKLDGKSGKLIGKSYRNFSNS
jgi:hypothetical protein